MSTRTVSSLGLALLLAAAPIAAADDCEYSAERQASVDLAGATLIEIDAAAGSLVVEGRPGLTRAEARGTACAPDEDLLEGIRIVTRQRGNRVRIVAEVPDSRWGFRSSSPRLDLTIEVPVEVALSIKDSSGSLELANVGATELDDSSGSIVAENVRGRLSIHDSSGSIRVRDVDGDIELRDSSGSIDVRGVRGSVVVDADSSGSIEITDVDLDVLIRRDSSGSIEVADVGGDFTVERDGSGGIDYRRVGGRVELPRGHRHR